MLRRLVWRLPLLLAVSVAAIGPARMLARSAAAALETSGQTPRVVWGAMVLGGILAMLARRRLEWVAVFAHEQAHAVAALSLLRPVTGFRATARAGGYVTYRGAPSLWIVSAPYTLPLLALPALGASVATNGLTRPTPFASATIGAALGVHLALAAEQVSRNAGGVRSSESANDFAPFGRPATLLYILVLNIVLIGTLIAFATGGATGVTEFWSAAMRHDLRVLRPIVAR